MRRISACVTSRCSRGALADTILLYLDGPLEVCGGLAQVLEALACVSFAAEPGEVLPGIPEMRIVREESIKQVPGLQVLRALWCPIGDQRLTHLNVVRRTRHLNVTGGDALAGTVGVILPDQNSGAVALEYLP